MTEFLSEKEKAAKRKVLKPGTYKNTRGGLAKTDKAPIVLFTSKKSLKRLADSEMSELHYQDLRLLRDHIFGVFCYCTPVQTFVLRSGFFGNSPALLVNARAVRKPGEKEREK